MRRALNAIEYYAQKYCLAIVLVDEFDTVTNCNVRARAAFNCPDMIDLPASYFFPQWSNIAFRYRKAFITTTAIYDSNGILRVSEVVGLCVRVDGELARGLMFKSSRSR